MSVTKDLLPRVTAPALVLTSPDDHIVPAVNGAMILNGIRSPLRQQVLLQESYHVATLDNDADLIHTSVRSFFKQAL